VEEIKDYIESGILELYVLGDVSHGEKVQVEALAVKHPAIKAELNEIEKSMEYYAKENSIEPSAELRHRILNSIVTNYGDDTTFASKAGEEKDNVIAFSAPKTINYYKYAFAACLALFLASSLLLVSVYSKLQDSNVQLAALQSDKQHFANQVKLMDDQLEVFRDGSFKILKLQATPKAPAGSNITIAWSPAKKKVMIDLGTMDMPVNDKAHQYQLWALVGGKPVDLGIFDKSSDSTAMKEMKSIASADAFAVTLEPRGGSINPTMDQLMVIGKF
jgi:anti-sigma-K factor RskA